MFQLRDVASLEAGMVNHAKAVQSRLTDFNIGSVTRTMLGSVAIELDEFYQRMLAGILDAIPTAIYNAFDFDLRTAATARGMVVVTFATALVDPITIPAGTVFQNPTTRTRYVSEAAATANAGATTLNVMVRCAVVGAVGNTTANTITQVLGYSLPVGATVGNLAITSGNDGETDDQRRTRFNAFIESLSRGTLAAVAGAAKQVVLKDGNGNITEYIIRLGYVEQQGWVGIYLWCGGGKPSTAMIDAVQLKIDGQVTDPANFETGYTEGYRPIGVKVTVNPMTETVVNIGLRVWRYSGASQSAVQAGIADAIDALFDATPNNTTLYLEAITEAALAVPGVRQCLISNTANIAVGGSNVLVRGTLSIEWM